MIYIVFLTFCLARRMYAYILNIFLGTKVVIFSVTSKCLGCFFLWKGEKGGRVVGELKKNLGGEVSF